MESLSLISNTEADITTTVGYQEALDDFREGRVYWGTRGQVPVPLREAGC